DGPRRALGRFDEGFTSRSRAGPRLHPEVRHGASRRRWCEWEQPHTFSWRSASAGDAEWMSGKSRARLAPILTETSSWMSDECRVVLRKPQWENEIGKKGPRLRGWRLPTDPFPARRPRACRILIAVPFTPR